MMKPIQSPQMCSYVDVIFILKVEVITYQNKINQCNYEFCALFGFQKSLIRYFLSSFQLCVLYQCIVINGYKENIFKKWLRQSFQSFYKTLSIFLCFMVFFTSGWRCVSKHANVLLFGELLKLLSVFEDVEFLCLWIFSSR